MKISFIGFGGYLDNPCYEDETGKIYFDTNDGRGELDLYTGAYRDECGEISGEPNERVEGPFECDEPFKRNPREHDYRMLSRYKSDCDYFLGAGNGYVGHLYFGDVDTHCNEMEKLWKSFAESERPEWISLEQIQDYRTKMKRVERKEAAVC